MIWVQISCGQGPSECMRAVWHVLKKFAQEANEQNCSCEVLNAENGSVAKSFKSVLLKVSGEGIDSLRQQWEGAVCWKEKSPFRPHHKRSNWFVKVSFLAEPQKQDIDLSQIRFEALRGGGPGGQHVNKSSTAIRATYIPSGLAVFCHEERSQLRNKELALARLVQLLKLEEEEQLQNTLGLTRMQHYKLERGNAVRIFNGKL